MMDSTAATTTEAGTVRQWPHELSDLVDTRSGGRLRLAENGEVGRHLLATRDLPARVPVLTEWSLLAGSDEAHWLRQAASPDDAEGMIEAWERPEEGGANPLAHFDLFSAFALLKQRAAQPASGPQRDAAERLDRVSRWFCRPGEDGGVDRDDQAQKVGMLRSALRPELRKHVSLEDLVQFDDVLTRNAEEFAGAPAILGAAAATGRPPCLGRRRFQAIFPCKDLIQHSCEPNCLTAWGPCAANGEVTLQIVPTRDIKAGEQLSWCYLPYWKTLWPTQLRRHELHQGWHFWCRCPRCAGASPERVMAFRCPGCGKGEFCPAAPCAEEGNMQAGHLKALTTVKAMACGACQLTVSRAASGEHAGYVDRCLDQEAATFGLPWKGVFGRDMSQGAPESRDLLAETHWLLADHASHELENAPAIAAKSGLANPGANLADVDALLARIASGAGTIAAALKRLLGHQQVQWLPEVMLAQALCTGKPADFTSFQEVNAAVLVGLDGAQATTSAVSRLCTSRAGFLEAEGVDLKQEAVRLKHWAAIDPKDGDGTTGLAEWVLRRLWLSPDFGWTPPVPDQEEGGEEEAPELEVEEDGPPEAKRSRMSPL